MGSSRKCILHSMTNICFLTFHSAARHFYKCFNSVEVCVKYVLHNMKNQNCFEIDGGSVAAFDSDSFSFRKCRAKIYCAVRTGLCCRSGLGKVLIKSKRLLLISLYCNKRLDYVARFRVN